MLKPIRLSAKCYDKHFAIFSFPHHSFLYKSSPKRVIIEPVIMYESEHAMKKSNLTLDYYNSNTQQFIDGTISVDFERVQNHFLSKLAAGTSILDFGCGSGRDTKYFLTRGYEVDAMDGSEELCRFASAYTGIEVRQQLFQQLDEVDKYDGIWACASILHLPKYELPDVLAKMCRALKANGIIYASFKYGDFEGMRNERYFTDLTEASARELLKEVPMLAIEEMWLTGDARPDRGDERWLNLILRKSDINYI